jgi:hypothetical protein
MLFQARLGRLENGAEADIRLLSGASFDQTVSGEVLIDPSGTNVILLMELADPFWDMIRTSDSATAMLLGKASLVLPRFSSGLFRAMFAMEEIKNGNEIYRRVSA